MIIPGDKNLGMVRYKDQLFAFASLENAIKFMKSPDEYIEDIVKIAKMHPDYVQLLHLYKYFPTVEALEKVFITYIRLDHSRASDCLEESPSFLRQDVKWKRIWSARILTSSTTGTSGITVVKH
jgi:Domain of unknown function